jgi:hypothetical protein
MTQEEGRYNRNWSINTRVILPFLVSVQYSELYSTTIIMMMTREKYCTHMVAFSLWAWYIRAHTQ